MWTHFVCFFYPVDSDITWHKEKWHKKSFPLLISEEKEEEEAFRFVTTTTKILYILLCLRGMFHTRVLFIKVGIMGKKNCASVDIIRKLRMWSFFSTHLFCSHHWNTTNVLISYYPRYTFPVCEQGIIILYLCRIIMLEEGRGSSICPCCCHKHSNHKPVNWAVQEMFFTYPVSNGCFLVEPVPH